MAKRPLRATKKKTKRLSRPPSKATLLEHLNELRRRLTWVAIGIVAFASLGWYIQDILIRFLIAPAADQEFIYTTPGGGFSFLLIISIYFGIAMSVPLIVYQLLRFIEPVLKRSDSGFIAKCTVFSAILAALGIAFAYYIGLPAALHFLTSALQNDQIEAMLSINSYMSFVTVYLAGSALIFQIPLIMLFINRIKPLQPKKLLKAERWVIVASFIIAAIITPTPDLMNLLIVAVPMILIYQLGIVLVWVYNKRANRARIEAMRQRDSELQAKRQRIAKKQLILVDNIAPVASVSEQVNKKKSDGVLDVVGSAPLQKSAPQKTPVKNNPPTLTARQRSGVSADIIHG